MKSKVKKAEELSLKRELRENYIEMLRMESQKKKEEYLYEQSKAKMARISHEYKLKMKELLQKQELDSFKQKLKEKPKNKLVIQQL